MSFLPKRPGPYLVLLLLAVLVIIVTWMFRVVTSPEIREAVRERKAAVGEAANSAPSVPALPVPAPTPAMKDLSIDPHLKQISEQLHDPDQPPEQDLEILEELLSSYRRATGGNPAGENFDFAAALVGEAPQGVFLSRSSPAVKEGALVDRWGTPYWFHPNTAHQVEIRSAGPDRQLFTDDDVVINPSPEGFGASPEASPESL
jgi:hypothetical protein